ncbi:hypothetical protein [Vibrio rotiferianus]|uniref:hypothetical protein n=1 Tax=Vibrio rotiferianus TaxID=190895 RepID=UPI0003AB3269|nr:hypothetical protein [Vibrio rotiferianus]PIB17214.1 hypothetical protein B853_07327 [Vibrio rotiferianus CAIM 577 = LMG 21460]
MKKLVAVSAVAVFSLVGCGGGGGSASSGSTDTKPQETFAYNGLYANEQDQVLMLVDSSRTTTPIIVGDFASNAVMAAHTVQTNGSKLNIKGVTFVDTYNYVFDSTVSATADFDSNGVMLNATVNNQLLSYSLAKASDSKPLAEIVGTHTNITDGTVWTIDTEGNLTVNGICQMYGQLTRNGSYFDVKNIQVSNCRDSAYDGVYQGVVATAMYQGSYYLSGVMTNDEGAIWGSVSM